jgi:hypothetical protein
MYRLPSFHVSSRYEISLITKFCNEARGLDLSFEQKRTRENGNGNREMQRRPASSPYALLWCPSFTRSNSFVIYALLSVI